MSKTNKSLIIILIAIIGAIFIGNWSGTETRLLGIHLYAAFDLLGTLFIRSLTLIVVPLVSSSIITGVARIGGDEAFGRLGAKTFGFYILTTLFAICIGLVLVNLIEPGLSPISEKMKLSQETFVEKKLLTAETPKLSQIVLQIIPANIVDAFQGQMLGLIFFSLLFGYALSKIESQLSTLLFNFWHAIFQTMLRITHMILRFLPLGVFCLVAKVFATSGIGSLKTVSLFFVTVVLGLATFTFIGLPLLLRLIAGINPLRHFRAMGPALITAFSTSSSAATLPVTMECVEKRAGVSNRICSLVVPLGTSINLSGSALYECVAAIFVAQAYGIEISFATQFAVILLALITSMGVAGIPSGSLVSILVILKTIGLPPEGIGLFLAVDRLLDMCRTTTNVFSDSCCAVLVASSEGEKILKSK